MVMESCQCQQVKEGVGGRVWGWGKEPRRVVCEKIPMRDLREMSCLLDWWAMNWRIQLKEEA